VSGTTVSLILKKPEQATLTVIVVFAALQQNQWLNQA